MAEETMTEEEQQGGEERQAQGFDKFSQRFVDNDPRMQAFKGLESPELAQQNDARLTAMEIQQNIRNAQDDFKRLNPDASEVQVEEYVAAIFERDIVTADRIQKEVQRKRQEKEESEKEGKEKRIALTSHDTASGGGDGENRFTGQNTRTGLRRMLFGNG